jgi:hypothetical protein
MGPGRVPNPSLGGIPLMGDPDMGPEILKPVVLSHLFGITHDLQDHHVSALGQNKGLLVTLGFVKLPVQLDGVLPDIFIFYFSPSCPFKTVLKEPIREK